MMQDKEQSQSGFVLTSLPWILAAGTVLIYLLTLNSWVTVSSLPITAKITGWDWNTTIASPLLHVVTYPFRFLPHSIQPVALNVFSAVCAALSLALLARSVALLPHDRTREQRQRERSEFSLLTTRTAWMAPVLAVLVCGLELTFWEHATALTGEMLNLLLFAYVIRCLLEHRLDLRDSWLFRMALVYGLAVTNNWAMIGFFPGLLIALIWIKGASFFDFRFLTRLVASGVLGLLLYLLIPIVEIASVDTTATFWPLFKNQLLTQKLFLMHAPLRSRALVCSLTALLPLLVIGIRWPSTFGDTSSAGAAISSLMFKVVHAMFLAACVWVAFDQGFSPRRLGLGLPFLTFYYLGALSVGYFTGYFLLVCGEDPKKSWDRSSPGMRLVNRLVAAVVWVGVIAVPVALASKNLPLMRFTNGPALRHFSNLTEQALPEQSSAILSEDGISLTLLAATLEAKGDPHHHMLVNTQLLPFHAYQRYMASHHGSRWPVFPLEKLKEPIDAVQLLGLVNELSLSNQVYYLHPSFGYYFEYFYLAPKGIDYEFKAYPLGVIPMPPLTAASIELNQKFWSGMKEEFARLAKPISEKLSDAEYLGRVYSRALNYWGVQLQRNQRLDEARACFEDAQKLNADNVAAVANAKFNENLRSGRADTVQIEQSLLDKLQSYPTWVSFVQICGPVDEPSFCINLGRVFAEGGLYRQAAQELIRAISLKPDNLEARFQLANVYLQGQRPDKVMEVISEMRSQQDIRPLSLASRIELTRLEALASANPTNHQKAEQLLLEAHQKNPQFEQLLLTLAQIYLQSNLYTNALETLDKQLALAPNSINPMLLKSAIYIHIKAYDQALPLLNRVLDLDPKNVAAVINRAIVHFHTGRLEEAKMDYEAILKQNSKDPDAYYRLAEIAKKSNNTSDEIKYYRLYLKYAPAGAEEIKLVTERLKQLNASP